MKQCLFVDEEKNVDYGILTDDGNVICLECGGVIEPENFRLLEVYPVWSNLEYDGIRFMVKTEYGEWMNRFDDMTDEEFQQWFDEA